MQISPEIFTEIERCLAKADHLFLTTAITLRHLVTELCLPPVHFQGSVVNEKADHP